MDRQVQRGKEVLGSKWANVEDEEKGERKANGDISLSVGTWVGCTIIVGRIGEKAWVFDLIAFAAYVRAAAVRRQHGF